MELREIRKEAKSEITLEICGFLYTLCLSHVILWNITCDLQKHTCNTRDYTRIYCAMYFVSDNTEYQCTLFSIYNLIYKNSIYVYLHENK